MKAIKFCNLEMKIVLVVVGCVVALIVAGAVVFDSFGRLVERKAHERFEKMSPDERFKYQNDMRKMQLIAA